MVSREPDDMYRAADGGVPSPDIPIPQPELDDVLVTVRNGFSRAMYQLQTGQDAAFVITVVTILGTYARTGRGAATMAKFMSSPLYDPKNLP